MIMRYTNLLFTYLHTLLKDEGCRDNFWQQSLASFGGTTTATVYWPFIRDTPGELAPELAETWPFIRDTPGELAPGHPA